MAESTRVPGIYPQHDETGNLYTRRQNDPTQNDYKGTVVPGMNKVAPEVAKQSVASAAHREPVVGFLYSISRQGFGEFWPLHVGSNSIGRSPERDIYLPEQTVSDRHASLNIKQLKSTKKILASIRDEGSKNGIYVNNEELDYDAHEVKNHDIITIGDNYKLLVILIDAEEMGLSISEDFQPVDEAPAKPENFDNHFANPLETNAMYNSENRVENGTIAMDGSTPAPKGRTRFL